MKIQESRSQLRQFGFITGIGIPLIIGWTIPIITNHNFRVWTLWIGIPIFILACLKPKSLRKPFEIWMKIGEMLGWVNSRIILGLIFLLILQPISLIMKLFGYDPLKSKTKEHIQTYKENIASKTIDLERIF